MRVFHQLCVLRWNRTVYDQLVDNGSIVPAEEVPPPTVPMDYSWARVRTLNFPPQICKTAETHKRTHMNSEDRIKRMNWISFTNLKKNLTFYCLVTIFSLFSFPHRSWAWSGSQRLSWPASVMSEARSSSTLGCPSLRSLRKRWVWVGCWACFGFSAGAKCSPYVVVFFTWCFQRNNNLFPP